MDYNTWMFGCSGNAWMFWKNSAQNLEPSKFLLALVMQLALEIKLPCIFVSWLISLSPSPKPSLSQKATSSRSKERLSWDKTSSLPLLWTSSLVRAFSHGFVRNPSVTTVSALRVKEKLISVPVNWFPGASCCSNFQLPKFLVGWIKGAMKVTNSS